MRNRTADLLLTMETLCRLSYRGRTALETTPPAAWSPNRAGPRLPRPCKGPSQVSAGRPHWAFRSAPRPTRTGCRAAGELGPCPPSQLPSAQLAPTPPGRRPHPQAAQAGRPVQHELRLARRGQRSAELRTDPQPFATRSESTPHPSGTMSLMPPAPALISMSTTGAEADCLPAVEADGSEVTTEAQVRRDLPRAAPLLASTCHRRSGVGWLDSSRRHDLLRGERRQVGDQRVEIGVGQGRSDPPSAIGGLRRCQPAFCCCPVDAGDRLTPVSSADSQVPKIGHDGSLRPQDSARGVLTKDAPAARGSLEGCPVQLQVHPSRADGRPLLRQGGGRPRPPAVLRWCRSNGPRATSAPDHHFRPVHGPPAAGHSRRPSRCRRRC